MTDLWAIEEPAERAARLLTAGLLTDAEQGRCVELALLTSVQVSPAAQTLASNGATIRSRAATALTANDTFLAIASPGAGQVAAQTKLLTRECSALIRLLLRQLDTTAGT